jgi:hypothetical protein
MLELEAEYIRVVQMTPSNHTSSLDSPLTYAAKRGPFGITRLTEEIVNASSDSSP